MVNIQSNSLGYAIYPWNKTPLIDGVVMNYKYFGKNPKSLKYNLGNTLVHEIGHYLGLYHLWDNGGCDSTNDQVDDTPPQAYSYDNKPIYPQYSCGYSNMYMNYMDYVDDELLLLFTKGQQERVLACLNLFRNNFLTETASCYSPLLPLSAINIFPNPVKNKINIEGIDFENDKLNISLYDALGRQIKIKISNIRHHRAQIDFSNLKNGIYYLKIDSFMKKIVVLKD